MRCASVSVGIVDYIEPRYRESDMRLRYAASDATAFWRYATGAWAGEPDVKRHYLLTDRIAVGDEVRSAFDAVVTGGPLDLFVLYASGHGERGDFRGGWFCLADARPGERSLDGSTLDRLLGNVIADYVVVILDCCYAEAVAGGMTFFATLEGRKGRLIVASARADQRAWEDDRLERSIFSDVFLRALSQESPIRNAAGLVDAEAQLFPYVRREVPLLAAAEKRGYLQEPVTGGLAMTPLLLPTVESRSFGRPLTVAQTVRTRVRQIVVGGVIASAMGLVLLELLVFHLAVTGVGEVVVRPGFRSTFDLLPIHLTPRVDTGLTLADFDPKDEPMLRALADGAVWGLATHTDERGLRTWLTRVEPALRRARRASVRALAGGATVTVDVGDDPAPLDEVAFLAALTGRPAIEIGSEMYPFDRRVEVSCAADPSRHLDLTILSSAPGVVSRDMAWLAVTAPTSPEARARRLTDLVRLAAYRARHEPPCGLMSNGQCERSVESTLAEFRAFVSAVDVLVEPEQRSDELRRLAGPALAEMFGTWCGLHGAFALALVGVADERRAGEAYLRTRFESFDRSRQGGLPTPEQEIATSALGLLAARRPLDDGTRQAIASMVERDGATLTSSTPATTLLNDAASTQHLPERLTAYLFERLESAGGEHDFDYLVAARLLARNAPFLDTVRRDVLRQWLRKNAVRNRTMSDIHEALGFAAAVFPLEVEELALLESRLSPASLFPPRATNYRGESVISSTGEAAAVALGRAAQTTVLPDRVRERLVNFTERRQELPERPEILKGLAAQWYAGSTDLVRSAHQRLASARGNADRRHLEIEVACARFAKSSGQERGSLIKNLMERWRTETEPELRIALARLIARFSRLQCRGPESRSG